MNQQETTLDEQAGLKKAGQEYQRALNELEAGTVLGALARLEVALKLHDDPEWHSFLGFCIAKERGHVSKGLELCQAAIERQPGHPDHYYFLARVQLVAGRKPEAMQTLRHAMAMGMSTQIKQLLQELGTRRPPLISWLHRDNPCNKYLGIVLSRIGLR
ncbi:MAG: tetratricopeptide repeat protein [Trichlorobacter sp.]|jgi:predicted Zn-dependent protease